MPRRPAKLWMRSCVAGVTEKGSAADPGAVCGAVWQRKSAGEREAIVRAEEGRRRHGDMPGDGYIVEVFERGHWTRPMTMLFKDAAVEMAKREAKRKRKHTRVIDPQGTLIAQVYPPKRGGREADVIFGP